MQPILDRLAIGVAAACALHCLCTPILLVLFPALTAAFGTDDEFHRELVAVVLPSSVLALTLGCARHRDHAVALLGAAGLAALVVVGLFGHAMLGEPGERLATIVASLVLALAHWRNHRLCRPGECHR